MIKPARHVLLAEDDSQVRLLFSVILRRAGYKVTAAENGKMAFYQLNALRAYDSPPDLLLVDIHMPGLNGLDLIDEVSSEKNPIPMLVITGDETRSLREQLQARHCEHVMYKPVRPEELVEAVHDMTSSSIKMAVSE